MHSCKKSFHMTEFIQPSGEEFGSACHPPHRKPVAQDAPRNFHWPLQPDIMAHSFFFNSYVHSKYTSMDGHFTYPKSFPNYSVLNAGCQLEQVDVDPHSDLNRWSVATCNVRNIRTS